MWCSDLLGPTAPLYSNQRPLLRYMLPDGELMPEPREILVKRVILLSLQEKRDAKKEELEELKKSDAVLRYAGLCAELDLLEEAIKQAGLDTAWANVGKDRAARRTTVPRLSARSIPQTLARQEVLIDRHGYTGVQFRILKGPYSAMLQEFAGRTVPRVEVRKFFHRRYGFSVKGKLSLAYISYAAKRGMASRKGRAIRFEHLVPPDTSEVSEPTPDELRKAGLIK